VRDVKIDDGAQTLQPQIEQGGGCGAVHVVISVDEDLLTPVDGAQDAVDSLVHVRKEEGIVLVTQLGVEEILDLLGRVQPFTEKEFSHKLRTLQLLRESIDLLLLFRGKLILE